MQNIFLLLGMNGWRKLVWFIPSKISMKNRAVKKSIYTLGLVLAIMLLYFAFDILFALSEQPKNHLTFTNAEKQEIRELSNRYNCKYIRVRCDYDIIISENGERRLKIDSSGTYSIAFNWEQKDMEKSLCRLTKDSLKQFSRDLLPELTSKLRYIANFRTIKFHFSVDDDLHPVNGLICSKQITLVRKGNIFYAY